MKTKKRYTKEDMMKYNSSKTDILFVEMNTEKLLKEYIEDKGLIKDDIDRKYWTEQYNCLYRALDDIMVPVVQKERRWVFLDCAAFEDSVKVDNRQNKFIDIQIEKMIRVLFETHTQTVYEDSWKKSEYLTPEIYGLTPEEYREKHSCK